MTTTKPDLWIRQWRPPPLLVYRWLSLLPALWFLGQPSTSLAPLWLFAVAVAVSLAVSLLSQRPSFLKHPFVLGSDILIMATLLALSGVSRSPYLLHALTPLLVGASFFHLRGALLAAGGFTTLYLVILLVGEWLAQFEVELEELLVQIGGMALISGLVGQMADLRRRLRESEQGAQAAGDRLNQQILQLNRRCQLLTEQVNQLSAAHRQLESIHDMTMLLQGATDILTIEQRILRAVVAEVSGAQALIGLVNLATNKLDRWQIYPDNPALLTALYPLPLAPESGLLAQELLNRRGGWFNHKPLLADAFLDEWFSQMPWLMLPLVLKQEPVGLLLVAVEGGPPALSEEQLVVLSAIASQAALALSTIDQVKRLAIEQERNRIARDIHDTVTQSLFGIVFTLEACVKMLPEQADLVHQELIDLRDLAEQVRQEMRQSIHNLWPAELSLEQFKTDLCKYVNHCSGSDDFQVDFTIGGDFEALPLHLRRDLYRIAQEALANVAHHAQVNSARVSLLVEPHEVQLSIRDHGKGFDPKAVLAGSPERFGLRGMRERIQALHGTCEILSQVDQGAQILVRVPTITGEAYEP